MSLARNEAFIKWKSEGAEDGASRCDDCNTCRGGASKLLWAVFAFAARLVIGLFHLYPSQSPVVASNVMCPLCGHSAFWHTDTI